MGVEASVVDQPPRHLQPALHAQEAHARRCSPVDDSPVLLTLPAARPAKASSIKQSATMTSGLSLRAHFRMASRRRKQISAQAS